MEQAEWEKLSYDEKNRQLFLQQKELLDTFLARHAISQQQYDKSLGDLTAKMKLSHGNSMKKKAKAIVKEENTTPTDDMMIADIQRVARLLNTNSISLNEYLLNGGKYSEELIDDEDCGGFSNKCAIGGLKVKIDR